VKRVSDSNNMMGVIILIIVIVGYIFLKRLLYKGIDSAATVVNKKVIFKNEYLAERQLLSEKVLFDTKASIEDIMVQLNILINPVKELNLIQPTFYELMKKDNMVAYSYQNKNFERFVAIIKFDRKDDITQSVFEFLRWNEDGGMLLSGEYMESLRQKVRQAFEVADQDVKVSIVGSK